MKEKNKLYLIEVEKGKLVVGEMAVVGKEYEAVRVELKRCQEIIYNGDRQLKDLEGHVNYLQGENN